MPLALQFLAAIALLAALHTAVTALAGRSLGMALGEISLGVGPTLLSVGTCRLRVLPLGGSVVFDDLDSQPRAVRVLLPLAGIAALAAVAFALHPGSAGGSLAHGFAQIVSGGLAPLSTAQRLIDGAARFGALGFAPLLGMLAAKCAALNLLPLASMGGGQALLALVDPSPRELPRWKNSLLQASVWLTLALAAAWAVAVGFFVLGR